VTFSNYGVEPGNNNFTNHAGEVVNALAIVMQGFHKPSNLFMDAQEAKLRMLISLQSKERDEIRAISTKSIKDKFARGKL
jgi:hypothetical protein